MAVIKIVPMPGAKGDKGDEGAIGPQGLQGATGLQGPAGADAAWYYNGEYNPGAGYAIGDVVTYEGQTWYRKHANGGNVGDTPSEGLFWDLIAAKGADGGLTYWDGTGNPGTPTNPGIAILNGIATPLGGGLLLSASDKITINANNGEFINDATIPENQIATIGDLTTPTSGTWGHDFFERSSLTTSEYDVIADYYKIGELVYFDLSVNLGYVTDWGTPTDIGGGNFVWPGWSFTLPYNVKNYNSLHNQSLTNICFNGMIWDSTFAEDISERTSNDQGRNLVVGTIINNEGQSHVHLYTTAQSEYLGYAVGELRPISSTFPKDFTQPLNSQTGTGASRLRISGTYRAES